jgi:hypothetical protein
VVVVPEQTEQELAAAAEAAAVLLDWYPVPQLQHKLIQYKEVTPAILVLV